MLYRKLIHLLHNSAYIEKKKKTKIVVLWGTFIDLHILSDGSRVSSYAMCRKDWLSINWRLINLIHIKPKHSGTDGGKLRLDKANAPFEISKNVFESKV